MDQFRARFLGQVSLGTKMTVTWKGLAVPEDAKPPAGKNGCIYIGPRSFSSSAKIEENIASAKAAGYGDIQELDVPPCDPNASFGGLNCLVSGSTPSKYVWACPLKGTEVPSSSEAPSTAVAATPEAASSSLLPVAASVGVVALLAAFAGGLFGK